MAALHSNRHSTIRVDGAEYTLPATIGAGAGELPRDLADLLVSLTGESGEYMIVGETSVAEADQPQAAEAGAPPNADSTPATQPAPATSATATRTSRGSAGMRKHKP